MEMNCLDERACGFVTWPVWPRQQDVWCYGKIYGCSMTATNCP